MDDLPNDEATDVTTGPDEATIDADEATILLDIAEAAIRSRLDGRRTPDIVVAHLPPALHGPNGAFVTLHVAGELNGCVGNAAGNGALAADVSELAIKAAFEDPRLPALRTGDLTQLRIEISLLSAQVEVPAPSRSALLRQLQRHDHGLVIECGRRRALFLPSVWSQLPHPDDFLDHLFHKAGLHHETWPHDLVAAVFTTTTFDRDLG